MTSLLGDDAAQELTHKPFSGALDKTARGTQRIRRPKMTPAQKRNRLDFARKRLLEATGISNKRLQEEVELKFGSPLNGQELADLRREVGVGARKRRGTAKLAEKAAPDVEPSPGQEAQPASPNEVLVTLLGQAVLQMRKQGILKLTLFDDGRCERRFCMTDELKLEL